MKPLTVKPEKKRFIQKLYLEKEMGGVEIARKLGISKWIVYGQLHGLMRSNHAASKAWYEKNKKTQMVVLYKTWLKKWCNTGKYFCASCQKPHEIRELKIAKNGAYLCPIHGHQVRYRSHNRGKGQGWAKRLRKELGVNWKNEIRKANLPIPPLMH